MQRLNSTRNKGKYGQQVRSKGTKQQRKEHKMRVNR